MRRNKRSGVAGCSEAVAQGPERCAAAATARVCVAPLRPKRSVERSKSGGVLRISAVRLRLSFALTPERQRRGCAALQVQALWRQRPTADWKERTEANRPPKRRRRMRRRRRRWGGREGCWVQQKLRRWRQRLQRALKERRQHLQQLKRRRWRLHDPPEPWWRAAHCQTHRHHQTRPPTERQTSFHAQRGRGARSHHHQPQRRRGQAEEVEVVCQTML